MRVGAPSQGTSARRAGARREARAAGVCGANGKVLPGIRPIDALEIDGKAFAPQQHVTSSIAEAAPLAGQRPETVAQREPLSPPRSIATRRAARPTSAQARRSLNANLVWIARTAVRCATGVRPFFRRAPSGPDYRA